jgi:Co/Zn/Cd efflux system component
MGECCGCGKGVDVAALEARQKRVLKVVLAINVASFALMALAAWHGGSSSLLSGSLDSLGDALTYAISLAVVAPAPGPRPAWPCSRAC